MSVVNQSRSSNQERGTDRRADLLASRKRPTYESLVLVAKPRSSYRGNCHGSDYMAEPESGYPDEEHGPGGGGR